MAVLSVLLGLSEFWQLLLRVLVRGLEARGLCTRKNVSTFSFWEFLCTILRRKSEHLALGEGEKQSGEKMRKSGEKVEKNEKK
jgi:hypothetical protein